MKKNNDMPKEQFICSVCGKEISGDHVIIQTRRHTTLHIHHECMRAGRKTNEKDYIIPIHARGGSALRIG